jgi:4-hydroxy-tetrahydrodipicolinate reductase
MSRVRRAVADAGIGVVVAPNFSAGVVIFEAIVARRRACSRRSPSSAPSARAHHAAKKDAPSGTALFLAGHARRRLHRADRRVVHRRHVPGTHTGIRRPGRDIVLTHSARDRSAFARGALSAAKWVNGRRGWFTMKDVLGV